MARGAFLGLFTTNEWVVVSYNTVGRVFWQIVLAENEVNVSESSVKDAMDYCLSQSLVSQASYDKVMAARTKPDPAWLPKISAPSRSQIVLDDDDVVVSEEDVTEAMT